MDDSARYCSPILSKRSRGERLIEAYSPKLGRRLQCFDHHAFEQWLRLESDPLVETFCERPATIEFEGQKRVADFWVRQSDAEMFLILGEEHLPTSVLIGDTSVLVRSIPPAELAAARMWVSNWEQMIVSIVSCQRLITEPLIRSVLKCVTAPVQLSRIERELVVGDPTLVRAAVYQLLHQGRLKAPQLMLEPLSFLTTFEPV
jgi:hypothetical protein